MKSGFRVTPRAGMVRAFGSQSFIVFSIFEVTILAARMRRLFSDSTFLVFFKGSLFLEKTISTRDKHGKYAVRKLHPRFATSEKQIDFRKTRFRARVVLTFEILFYLFLVAARPRQPPQAGRPSFPGRPRLSGAPVRQIKINELKYQKLTPLSHENVFFRGRWVSHSIKHVKFSKQNVNKNAPSDKPI